MTKQGTVLVPINRKLLAKARAAAGRLGISLDELGRRAVARYLAR